jgi:Pectate lyase
MKKGILIILSFLFILAVSVWFACNPMQQNGNASSNFSVLDDTGSARLTLYTSIIVNGSTWDGNGATLSAKLYDGENSLPIFTITNGAVKNCTISSVTYDDGIWFSGNCSLDNVILTNVSEHAINVIKPGTSIVSNCTFNNSKDQVIMISDLCTITTQSLNADGGSKFIRQNGMKTWKMTSYCNDCTANNMVECIFRSDSPSSTFYYHNLTTNCSTIGYPGTNVIAN